jgi:hypothetical protein
MSGEEYRVSVIGGEPATGGLVRGVSTKRIGVAVGLITAGAILSPFLGQASLLAGVIVAAVMWFASARSGADTIADRVLRRLRWAWRRARGYDRLTPFDEATWPTLQGRERRHMRVRPDGADSLRWLQSDPDMPGIAWFEPAGQLGYLVASFEVEGSVRGLGGPLETEQGAIGWGQFLASLGGGESLATRVQTLTRVLPPELAPHQQWVLENMDPSVPRVVAESYRDVLAIVQSTGMVQRHFVAVSWPLTSKFYDAAALYGNGPDAWRRLMDDEIRAKRRALGHARLGTVRPLTARQVGAFVLHSQDPSRPLDQVVDVDPEALAVPSHDLWGACVTTGVDGQRYYHATAMIRSADVAVTRRGSYWTTPWLTGLSDGAARTISFHIVVVPAVDARHRVDQEYEDALSDMRSADKRGRTLPRAAVAARESAELRMADLAAGTQHHGVEWVMYVTVTARSVRDLEMRKRVMQEQAQNDMAIARLDWQDSYQAAAMGATWPLGRGIRARANRAGAMRDSLSRVGKRSGDHDDDN